LKPCTFGPEVCPCIDGNDLAETSGIDHVQPPRVPEYLSGQPACASETAFEEGTDPEGPP